MVDLRGHFNALRALMRPERVGTERIGREIILTDLLPAHGMPDFINIDLFRALLARERLFAVVAPRPMRRMDRRTVGHSGLLLVGAKNRRSGLVCQGLENTTRIVSENAH